MKKIILKVLKILGITIGSIILLMVLLPTLFPGVVSNKIKAWANGAITGELNFSKASLSFFNHFPSLTLTLHDFSLKGSAPFQNDTLVSAKEIALGVNLASIFSEKININEIYLTKANIHVQVDTAGNANYNVYKSTPSTKEKTTSDSSSASLKIERIQIDHSNIIYDDHSIPILITAYDFNYAGQGDLSKSIFDLQSNLNVGRFSLAYAGQEYIHSKKLNADLITKINTGSLSFIFEKNDLKINSLPVKFKGRMDFLKEGYDMDFRLLSGATDLHDVFTALPPEYGDWMEKTNINGPTEINAALTGRYDATTNTMPSLSFDMKVRKGYIAYDKAPAPIQNIYLDFRAALPHFNMDSLYIHIDSLYFNLGKGYFNSVVRVQGLNIPHLHARINSELDLDLWSKALGLKPYEVKGIYTMNFTAEGEYKKGVVYRGWRKTPDTTIVSIPSFNLQSSLKDGYFKYATLPQGISNINFKLDAACKDNDFHHTTLSVTDLNATALNNFIKGQFHLYDAKDYSMDADISSVINLAEIQKFYPLDSMSVAGDLNVDIKAKGKYIPEKRVFPVTTAKLSLHNGSVQTKYYPHPIEQIQVDAAVVNTTGNMKGMKVNVTPISFLFEGQPFKIKADLQNFDNLKYDVASKGIIDVGKIYKVFSQKGIDVKGFIRTNLLLRGLQSDATAGLYDRLRNSGKLELKDISITLENFPKPFVIKTGVFEFKQEKVWFRQFLANYGSSNFTLNGYLGNVIAYATKPKAVLTGKFDLNSDYILVDEFTAFGDTKAPATSNVQQKPAATPSGVVIVPANLSITFNASAKKVQYNGLDIRNFKGEMRMGSGKIILNQTGFVLIGAPIVMDASYGSLSPTKAYFTYKIDAKDFDVKRAYKEIKIFHDMATSASKAEGIISLNYELGGKLDANMMPIYPSLKGKGVISLQKVKVNGLKLFGAVSKATGRDSVNNPDLSKVDIKSSINNNIITIERTKMRVFGFRPRIEGQMSLDGKLNLKFRLGLPPFGIFGIPMTITGTSENPKVNMRRGKDSDSLEETEDKDDEGE